MKLIILGWFECKIPTISQIIKYLIASISWKLQPQLPLKSNNIVGPSNGNTFAWTPILPFRSQISYSKMNLWIYFYKYRCFSCFIGESKLEWTTETGATLFQPWGSGVQWSWLPQSQSTVKDETNIESFLTWNIKKANSFALLKLVETFFHIIKCLNHSIFGVFLHHQR